MRLTFILSSFETDLIVLYLHALLTRRERLYIVSTKFTVEVTVNKV